MSDAWTVVRGHPARFLASVWPWRSLAYVASTVPIGLAWLIILLVVLVVGVATVVVVAGLFVLAGIPMLAHLAATGERRRLRLIFPGRPVSRPSGPRDPEHGRGSWSETGVAVLLATLLWPADAVVLVLLTAPVVLLIAPVLVRSDVIDI